MPEGPPSLSRRAFLTGAAALGAGILLPPGAARARGGLGSVRPRDAWGERLPPVGPLEVEAAGDVRFMLVHHSASPNSYAPGDVAGLLRSFYRLHTAGKGWPDIAYNFLVDRYGTVWEGRAGSLEQPVKGDATGGSQGFALLASFVGDHSSEPPTPEACEAMARLLADLAQRYGIDARPGARTRFVSRGSSRHPRGAEVSTATIAGHRDMSVSACPGDAAHALVRDVLPARVTRLIARPRRRTPPVFPDRLASVTGAES
jgi:hypothetical protein